jgi:hypothetical protein
LDAPFEAQNPDLNMKKNQKPPDETLGRRMMLAILSPCYSQLR